MKLTKALCITAAICCLFTACSKQTVTQWEVDKDNHWKLDSEGYAIETAAHSLEGETCTVCGAKVSNVFGQIWVQGFNDKGDQTASISYDADGFITENKKSVFTYDKEGNKITETKYSGGALLSEDHYAIYKTNKGTRSYIDQITTYRADGSKLKETYDKKGTLLSETLYSTSGSEVYTYRIETEADDLGQVTVVKKYDGDTLKVEVNYEYDEDGNQTKSYTYENGTLTKEEYYSNEKGFVYRSSEVIYNADGTQTYNTYDENGNLQ